MITVKASSFIKSASDSKGFFKDGRTQIAVVGKSNVGKSSFINMIAGRRKLAKTSNTPGRTRLVNYFDMGDFILTDLPGYGYAEASKTDIVKWGNLIETYLKSEEDLKRVILLVDIRHDAGENDLMLVNFFASYRIPFNIVATKADKLSKLQLSKRLPALATSLGVGVDDIFATSAETAYGRDRVLDLIESVISVKSDEEI